MGGNALKNILTERLTLKDYEELKLFISKKLNKKNIKHIYPIEIPDKDNFGDIDVLVLFNKININEFIIENFNPTQIVKNSNVYSFNIKNYQIDFIISKDDNDLEMKKFYFSYGDTCGILGRIISAYGLKLGLQGLFCNLYHSTIFNGELNTAHSISKIILSTNPQEIMEYLNLDFKKYYKGFKNNDEIFDWIKTCRFYKKEFFYNLNNKHRQRAQKRDFYIKFLESIEINPDEITKTICEKTGEIFENKQIEALTYFNKLHEIDNIKNNFKKHNIIKNKFSCKKFIDLGINSKDISKILNNFYKFINVSSKDEFNEWIYKTEQNIIDNKLKEFITPLNI